MTEHNETRRVEHRVERRFEVRATPEQVWDAIATTDGIATWMAPARLDPRVGGEVSFDLDGFISTGVVTGYSPNHRFAYEEPWPIADNPEELPEDMAEWFASIGVPLSRVYADLASISPIATEFLVESQSGGHACCASCRARTAPVQSGSTSSSPRWSRAGAKCSTTSPSNSMARCRNEHAEPRRCRSQAASRGGLT